ncbi:hypothetical protein R3X25_05145 [Lutibacter sp. TH_r2]|uniref:hypothetical protein n=1 Tax=Lutibacter sp. TH_r2 TaxID=3082083 RepID=UPI0029533677|nr:hypothetical protein [Lutibacter sp. TH_r2]MDV7186659.1 hypothetical protein [Lutibacter sp. TH_r2]
MKTIVISILTFVSLAAFGQNNAEQTKIKDYLESSLLNKNTLLISSAWQKVTASDIYQSELLFSTNHHDGHNIVQLQYFIKTGNKLIAFKDQNDLLASNAFLESLKSKKFKLTTEDDGVAFQSFLKLLDYKNGLGFFTEDNTWYFIRDKFFDDIKAYIVTTDSKGEIVSIVYQDELEKNLPETLLQAGKNIDSTNSEASISKADSDFMRNYLYKNTNYKFEITPLNFYSINKISNISINKCNLKVTEGEEGNSFTNNTPFVLVSSNNEYIKSSIDVLLEIPIFLNSLQEKYTLKTEDDARLFQYVLDDLSPVSKFDIELKTFYKKDNMWFFVREKSFDDLKGYILLVDEKNKVSHLEYAKISEESILRIKMKDPNFKADYKFKLEQPTTTKVKVKQGEDLYVEISFDANMVNAVGAWVLTQRDGENAGMYAGTSIDSPFTKRIPGAALENQFHTYEYYLLKNGEKNVENALGKVKIEIEVE